MKTLLLRRKWQVLSLVLAVGLGFSVGFNVYQSLVLSGLFKVSSGRTLMFLWPPGEQKIVDGTLRIEVALNWEGENLSMTVNVNDDDYPGDSLGFVFDSNKDLEMGGGDPNYVFFSDQMGERYPEHPDAYAYYPPNKCAVLETGISWVHMAPDPSPYHTATFNSKTGLTFKISFPKETIDFHWPMLMLLAFQDADLKTGFPRSFTVGTRFRML